MQTIQLKNIKKIYRMGDVSVPALNGVDLEVARGEFVSIMGASGSGKSTLMNILGCLDSASAGTYYLDGIHVNGMSLRDLADIRNQKIGFVFQGYNLLSRTTALENVSLPMLYNRQEKHVNARQKAQKALERVGLGERIHHEPNQLSGGQQQRVAIARALVNDPALILADEPTGNLDSRTSIEVMSLFQALNNEGITVILVTHEPEIADYSRRVVVLRDGIKIRDEKITRRRDAARDLGKYPVPEAAVSNGTGPESEVSL